MTQQTPSKFRLHQNKVDILFGRLINNESSYNTQLQLEQWRRVANQVYLSTKITAIIAIVGVIALLVIIIIMRMINVCVGTKSSHSFAKQRAPSRKSWSGWLDYTVKTVNTCPGVREESPSLMHCGPLAHIVGHTGWSTELDKDSLCQILHSLLF